MADTPVDTDNDTPAEPPAGAPAPDAADTPAADAPAEETPPAPAKKAAAKRAAPRKKAATAKKAAPAKKTAAKKTTAKKTAAKPAAEPAPTPAEVTVAEAPAAEAPAADPPDQPAEAAVDPAVAPLFQVPEKPAAKRTRAKAKPKAAPAEEATEEPAEESAAAVPEEPPAPAVEQPPAEGEEPEDDEAEDGEGAGSTSAQRRRRRRGGRRRRKPGGASGATEGEDDDEAEDDPVEGEQAKSAPAKGERARGGQTKSTPAKGERSGKKAAEQLDETDKDDEGEGAESGDGSSGTSRRRRRRRREGDSGEGGGDDSNTVTKVRKARSAEDEITAVSGSTRLEAKKQRRREGREAGRRRAPIISEAEFLARRESVDRRMVVRQRNDLIQIAVLEDKVLVEHYVARESQTSLIGNVYLGRVQNVLPSMEAAFIDIGKGRNAVLYAGEVNWSALGHKEGAPRKIESVLQSGQTVLVQVTKDPVGHKGARLTSQVSLAGRFLVYVPDGTTSGISRKLPDTERARLKSLLKEIVPESAGVIVRTAAEGASEDELTRDVERLKARWEDIEAKVAKGNAPQLLYGEPDLTLKVVRDLFTEDFSKLVVQGEDAWETVHEYVEHVAPDLADRLEHYEADNGQDAFAAYRIDEQIAKGLDRKVWLPSGGSLIIDRTEAMTVVDVNTGKFTGSGGNLEETVTKNNLEAAEEIVRQLRLRDIGGIIVVDFIDMVLESNRDLVLRRLVECLGRDRTRHQVAEVTSLGLVQMTRKRIGTGLLEAFSETCDHCQGRGLVVHELPVEPRRGGDDEARRSTGRRRGRGKGGQPEQEAPKPVPSPKVVAAMAKAHPPNGEDGDQPVDVPVTVVEEPGATEQTEPVTSADAPAALVEAAVSEDASTPDAPATETPAAEVPADDPVEETPAEEPAKPVTKVVTRTRRRAASRPAGPPTATEPLPATGGTAPVAGVGTPPVDGAVEPNVGEVEPGTNGAPPPAEEPHVEHVPIKKKGARKR